MTAVIQCVQYMWKLIWTGMCFIWNLLCVCTWRRLLWWICMSSLCWLLQHLQAAVAHSLLKNVSTVISFGISVWNVFHFKSSSFHLPESDTYFSENKLALEIAKWDERANLGRLANFQCKRKWIVLHVIWLFKSPLLPHTAICMWWLHFS